MSSVTVKYSILDLFALYGFAFVLALVMELLSSLLYKEFLWEDLTFKWLLFFIISIEIFRKEQKTMGAILERI